MDKQREKLIEMLMQAKKRCATIRCDECEFEEVEGSCILANMADHLLANGVIVPPVKMGDKLYNKHSLVDDCCYWKVKHISIFADESGFVDDSDNWYSFEDFGKTVFLSREDAEKALGKNKNG
jgi:hypothetical protein